jgi:acyl-CoA synthetase (NDP forming)
VSDENRTTGANGIRLRRMLEARSVAVVGASDRPDSFGWRLATEALRSSGVSEVHLVHPGRREVFGQRCVPSLADVPDPVDLVLLGVPDRVLVEQVALASARGDGGAVVFGTAAGLRDDLIAAAAGLEMCGAGCMGFVNVSRGIRAIGYLEPSPLPSGPIALVTHSGSMFSALLRTHRRLEYSLIVSSGQELVTSTAHYLDYALTQPETRVVGLVLETPRDVPLLRRCLASAAIADVPVVALTVGRSVTGQALVDAHSGALAGSDAGWQALFAEYGVHRVDDLGELTDSLEAFAIGRRVRRPPASGGIATVHDSGAERVLVADIAADLDVPFAALSESTKAKLTDLLEPGLEATNPLDVWGSGAKTEELFTRCLQALAEDSQVELVALAVDLVPELDGDDSFPRALQAVLATTDKPVVVLTNLASAVDQDAADLLRASGVPVFEGTRSGLRAIGHLLRQARPPARATATAVDDDRRARWLSKLRAGLDAPTTLELLADYGIRVTPTLAVGDVAAAEVAAARLGYPVVLKTGASDVHHKVDVDGVRTGVVDARGVRAAYADIAARLGPNVLVQRQVPQGLELCLGIWRDPLLGPLVMVAAGGTLVELLGQRAVALPPLAEEMAARLVSSLSIGTVLDGYRGGAGLARDAVVASLVGVGRLAHELGDEIEAVDVNPLVVTTGGAIAVDALVIPRR